jgi:Flp pilus assembly protein TadG
MKMPQCSPRRAALAVEAAIVWPALLFLLLTFIVGGTGVFRYEQVACQAREAARWACVRGSDYQLDTNQSSPTQQQIITQTVVPMAVGMDVSQLSVQIQWINQGTGAIQDWDSASKAVKSLNSSGVYVSDSVRVTVSYTWSPGMLVGPMVLRSVCEMPMSH